MRNRYYFFLGTTAEYIKVMPVIKEFKKRRIPFKIISSGQNELTKSELHIESGITKIDITLSSKPITATPFGLVLWWVKTFIKGYILLRSEFQNNRVVCIVHGDTVSTLLGATLAKILKARVVHIEAGLRSRDFLSPFPEEINRVLTSYLADIHYCPNQWAVNNLKKVTGLKINTHGNTLIDGMRVALEKKPSQNIRKLIGTTSYFLGIIHRQENVLNKQMLTQFLDLIIKSSKKKRCVFILHSLTRKYLSEYGLLTKLTKQKTITCLDRIPYFDMMYVMSHATYIITDGGSNQEESYYLGKPTLILRKNTERIEGLGRNVVMSGLEFPVMNDFITHYSRYQFPKVTAKVSPSAIIAKTVLSLK